MLRNEGLKKAFSVVAFVVCKRCSFMEDIIDNDLKIGKESGSTESRSESETEKRSSAPVTPENAIKSETRIERSIGDTSFHRRPRKHLKFRQRRSFMKMLPNAITLTAFCFGLTAIRFGLFHKWDVAVACVLISAFLDSLDGRVARVIGHSSQFGAELDSLSDLVCFGVAPAMLIFLNGLYMMDGFGWGICIFLAMCCAMRLARFNAVLIMNEPQPAWAKKYFTGVPAPAGAAIALFPMILFFATKNPAFLNSAFVVICALFSGIMMISRVKSFSSKMIEFKEGFASPELVIIGLVIICMMTAPWITLSCLIGTYIVMIPFGAYYYRRYKAAMAAAAATTTTATATTTETEADDIAADTDTDAADEDQEEPDADADGDEEEEDDVTSAADAVDPHSAVSPRDRSEVMKINQ